MVRRVNQEVIVLLGWTPAVLMQLAHPLVAAAVANHSSFNRGLLDQARRLQHTVSAMLDLTFGDPAAAARATSAINAVHDRVHGFTMVASGPFPAGSGYSAHDPALLRWVHATLQYAVLRAYQWYVEPLTIGEQDRYCREVRRIGPLLGIAEEALPGDRAALNAYLRSMLRAGPIAVTPTARRLADALLAPPLPAPLEPLRWLVRLPTVGLLPSSLRAGYGFTWGPAHAHALAATARATRLLLPLLPPALRYWPAARRRPPTHLAPTG